MQLKELQNRLDVSGVTVHCPVFLLQPEYTAFNLSKMNILGNDGTARHYCDAIIPIVLQSSPDHREILA